MGKLIKGVSDLATWCKENNRILLIDEWDYEKNFPISPSDVTHGTNKKVWWKCKKHNHIWQMEISNRTSGKQNCPYCSGRKVLIGFNDLQSQYPSLALEWHPTLNGGLTPSQVTCRSGKRIWWCCKNGHSWGTSVSHRVLEKTGCPYCSGKRLLKGFNDLATKYPEIAAEWNYDRNNGLSPTEIIYGSAKNVWWKCRKGHEWKASLNTRTGKLKTGCPVCSPHTSFPEQAILFYLSKYFSDVSYHNRVIIPNKEVDIYIPSVNTIIEYDGVLYHQEINKDEDKNIFCKEHKILLIRVRENGCPELQETEYLKILKVEPQNYSDLEKCICQIFFILKIQNAPEICIEKDYIFIRGSYAKSKKDNDLLLRFPEVASEWDYEKNNPLLPEDINCGSTIKVCWRCGFGHEWKASILSSIAKNAKI